MHKAYFPIYKDIFKTELVKKPNHYLLYSWLNNEACFIEKDVISFNGKNIEITYGQVVFGLKHWAKKTGFSEMNLRSSLAYLEKNNFIKKESNNKFSIITILSMIEHRKDITYCNNKINNFDMENTQVTDLLTDPVTDQKNCIIDCNNSKNEPINNGEQQTFQQTEQQQYNNKIIKNTINTSKDRLKNGIICPYEKIMDLYNEILSEDLHWVSKLSTQRKGHVKARCNDIIEDRGYETEEELLTYLDAFFKKVKSSPFLMGKVEKNNGQRPFRAYFDWLFKENNFLKITEGNYDR